MMKQKALLLNPPGARQYLRDLFCSKTSKTNWLNHPVDLVMLSGRLAEKYDVHFIDAVAERLSPDECFRKTVALRPDIIVWLTGVVSHTEDFPFITRLKDAFPFQSVSLGDIYYDDGPGMLRANPCIDAIAYDYASDDIVRYLEGDRTGIRNIVCRAGSEVLDTGIRRDRGSEFVLPVPRHELFVHKRYLFPFMRRRPFATVATDFGCPHTCSFCIIGTLGYKYRPVDNVIDELRAAKRAGAREIFFADQTWGAKRERAVALLEAMLREGFRFGWLCFTRVDAVDEPLLRLMRRAGCHTVIFGVESSDEAILKKYNKRYTTGQIRAAFALARRCGIDTVGTFIMGLPEETRETFTATVNFAKEIECDYFSFNIAVPRPGTGLRRQALDEGLVENGKTAMTMDQAGSFVSMATRALTATEVDVMVRRILFSFYLRPGYLWRRLSGIRSWYHLYSSLLQGLEIVKRIAGLR